MERHALIVAIALGLAAPAAPLLAAQEAVLGSQGEVYLIRTGAYGDLFPGSREFDRGNSVVALEVAKPGAASQRILVPGTGGPEVEKSTSMVFEDGSGTLFLLWESQINIHPILQLASFDGSRWSKTIEVSGNPFAPKTSPQFVVTRDSYEEAGEDGASATRHRTIIQLIWQEESGAGVLKTYYSPVVIKDGAFIGWNPVFSLDDYIEGRVEAAAVEGGGQPSLLRSPMIQTGRDERTVIVAYTSAEMGRLITVEIDVLPEQLGRLADSIHSHIIDLGREFFPDNLTALGEKIHSHIIDLGRAFRPEIIRAIADQARAKVLAGNPNGLTALADSIHSHIIDLGAQLSGRGLRGINGADATAKTVEFSEYDPVNTSPEDHLLQFRIVSNLPAPRVGAGTVRLFSSVTGEQVIVSWAQADGVLYRTGRAGGWGEPKELRFSDNLNLAKAHEILEQRVRNR